MKKKFLLFLIFTSNFSKSQEISQTWKKIVPHYTSTKDYIFAGKVLINLKKNKKTLAFIDATSDVF